MRVKNSMLLPHFLTLLLILTQLFLGSVRLVASVVTGSNNQVVSSSLSPPCQPSSSPAISYLFDSNFVMDVNGGGTADQTQVWVYAKNNTNGQKWSWYGNSTKEIKGLNGKCLDSGNGNAGEYLRINDCHGGNNQKWDITADSAIRQNNICISLNGGIKDGSALVMGDCSLSNCSAYWNYNGSSNPNESNYTRQCAGISSPQQPSQSGSTGSATGGGSGQSQGSQPSQPAPSVPSGGGNGSGNTGSQTLNTYPYDDENEVAIYQNDISNQSFESTPPPQPPTDVLTLAKTALSTTIGEINGVMDGLKLCNYLDLICYTTNGTYQSSLYSSTVVLSKFLYGVTIGTADSISFGSLFSLLLGTALKIPAIILSVLAMVSAIINVFTNLGSILTAYINNPIEDKMYDLGYIIGTLAGTVLLGTVGGQNIEQAFYKIGQKATSIGASSLAWAGKQLPSTAVTLFENGGKIFAKGGDVAQAMKNGLWSKIRDYFPKDKVYLDTVETAIKNSSKCIASAPSWLDRLMGSVRVSAACNDFIDDIINHSYQKHVVTQKEFPEVNSTSQFRNLINDVISNHSNSKPLQNGRTVFYRYSDNILLL